MDLKELLKAKRFEILETAAKFGASNVRIFGSVARDEADEKSDIDFLVNFEKSRSLFDQAGLIVALEDLLDCKVDVASEDGIKPRLRERIIKEAVNL